MHKCRSYDPDKSGRTIRTRMHACTHRTHIRLSKIVTAMSRFTASGLDRKEQYSCLYSRANPKDRLYLYSIHVVGCNNFECNFTCQHNCDVVNYVNYVIFYVDFVASN